MPAAVATLRDPAQVQALADPMRMRMLRALRTPASAASVARSVGRSRQNVGYHLKELERAGLIRHAGARRKGNFVEQLYQATAKRFVVSAGFAQDAQQLAAVFRDQASLALLSSLGERVAADAAHLIDRAAEGEQIPSATVDAELCFADEAARAAFMAEYVAALRSLLAKHSAAQGARYRVAMAAYLDPEEER
jgi:DNA-binding transcriptional ArsR family regulator